MANKKGPHREAGAKPLQTYNLGSRIGFAGALTGGSRQIGGMVGIPGNVVTIGEVVTGGWIGKRQPEVSRKNSVSICLALLRAIIHIRMPGTVRRRKTTALNYRSRILRIVGPIHFRPIRVRSPAILR